MTFLIAITVMFVGLDLALALLESVDGFLVSPDLALVSLDLVIVVLL